MSGGDIAEGQRDGDCGVALLALTVYVVRLKLVETLWPGGANLQKGSWLEGFLFVSGNVFQVVRPAGIVRKNFALGFHEFAEFFDTEFAVDEGT